MSFSVVASAQQILPDPMCLRSVTLSIALLAWLPLTASAATISIIVDDLGHRLKEGRRATALPGPVVCAILPHGQHSVALAQQAHESGKEVLLHQPMESSLEDKDPGPGKLMASMPDLEIATTLAYNLQSIPHVIGMNNHMGSRLTSDNRAMSSVMEAMRGHETLIFVDSITSPESVAAATARAHDINTLERDVFLDNVAEHTAIHRQFDKLVRIAQRRGHAIGIGHPYPETMDVLEQRLATLEQQGITLISLRRRITDNTVADHNKEQARWQPSSSPLPKVSKNLKPLPSPTYSPGPRLK